MKVVIIGSGNVANLLGKKIKNAGNEILEVVGRNKEKVSRLASQLSAKAVSQMNVVSSLADIYIITVSDIAIAEIADELRVNNKIVVHTAAAIPIDVLQCCSSCYGVIYPLQTIHKDAHIDLDIPVLLNGDSESTIDILADFSKEWSHSVSFINDEERFKLHVAAVVVNNFTNHLFAMAKKYCEENNLNFNLLKPLIQQTFLAAELNDPRNVQTGPAKRNDPITLAKHRQLLTDHPDLLSLYNSITDSIVKHYH